MSEPCKDCGGKRVCVCPEAWQPPEYIPAKPERHAVVRTRDLCPDDDYTGPYSSRAREEFEIEAAKDAIENAHSVGAGNDDGPDIDFDPPHNPETCRDPACDCYPF